MSFMSHYPTRRDAPLTQKFREHPEWYQPDFPGHEGVDWGIPVGTPIYAVADGEVFFINHNPDPNVSPYGIYVRMRHQGGQYETIYAHLSQVMVEVNQRVPAGHVIALSGHTGRSTGPHLHFTLKKRDATVNGETDYRKDVVDPHPYLDAVSDGTQQPIPPAQTTLNVQVFSEDGLNLRNAPVLGDVLARLPDGTIVGSLEAEDATRRKLGQYNQWLWVRAPDGLIGHVAAWYVNLPGASSPGQTGGAGGEAHRLQVNSPDEPLKLRQGPDTSYAILQQLLHGTVLESLESPAETLAKIGTYGQWLRVRTLTGQIGHVAAWYLCLSFGADVPSPDPAALSFGITAKEAEAPEELRSAQPDDLQRIKGIGPKSAALLIVVGICSFRQVAALTVEQLKAVLAEGGLVGNRVGTWPAQARVLSEAL
ncbi:MAG: peptidoglycan DD-metalloendopeptidase family protein [Anaerolineae bacterium]|nr:peptidoglycan DD-metalloendopeptidase family protein [Anaerolineae bacterium]